MFNPLIQFISNNQKVNKLEKIVHLSNLSNPRSLDQFAITIIDLSGIDVWTGDLNTLTSLFRMNDLKHLSIMIQTSKKTKIVFLYPQDCVFRYNPSPYTDKPTYLSKTELRNMLNIVESLIGNIFGIPSHKLLYGNTTTKIAGENIYANFYFADSQYALTTSESSNKVTTTKFNDFILTTLSFGLNQHLIDFLQHINLIQNKASIPDWVLTLQMFDDEKQKDSIDKNNKVIDQAIKEITESQIVIDKNNQYKSILYTNGDELVNVVFDILQQILDCDLTDFADENKEDFIIKFNNVTFIGEIKGVTSNIKSEHISQLDVHLQGYLDKLSEEGNTENVKSILIMNHQRSKNLINRELVHKNQIDLAKRNGSLIIETHTLLKIFEKFLNNEIECTSIKNLFISEEGLLELKKF